MAGEYNILPKGDDFFIIGSDMDYQPFDPRPFVPSLSLPPGSIDTHMHVFGPTSHYPYTPERTYTPTDASLADYRHMAQTVGLERTVVVQPSVYGTDNRATAEAVKALGPEKARGVAVVDASVSDEALRALHEAGFRGVRLNLLFRGGVDFAAVEKLAGRLAPMGWHIQFLIDVSAFEELEPRLNRLPVDCVIDHMGHMATSKGPDHPGFQSLLRLVGGGRCWVKLSGPYRITAEERPPYGDVTPFARALIAANPERMVWGSDWPHPHIAVPMPNDGALVEMLGEWAPDEAILRRIMVENPEELYGFERA